MRPPFQITSRAPGFLAAVVAALVMAMGSSAATAAVPAWTTYDHDPGRSAIDPDSAAAVTPTAAWSGPAQLDGTAWAQPLVYGSLVYVATENDTIYALTAATGAVVWQRSVGTPVPSGDLACGDITPTVGITSTPVIDPSSGRIYAVADVLAAGVVQHQLVALNAATGAPVAGFPVPVDPPGQDPKAILQRASLALDAGRVIVPYGGNDGDCGTYHGWLVSVAQDGTGTPATFEVDPGVNEHGGAIWGSGDGPSQDPAGNLFVSTGNGFSSSSTPDLQESVVELSPTLTVLAAWTASNWQALDNSDLDLGSSEPLPLPGGRLFEAGKDGVGRLLSATALGPAGQLFSAQGCSSGGVFGASLYRAGVIYVPCASGLTALSLPASGAASFTTLPGFSAPAGASGPPIFAAGLVWSTGWRGTGLLYGLDPSTGAVRFQTALGAFAHFATPSAGGGRLFVAAGSTLTALKIAAFPPATTTTLASSANPAAPGTPITLTATVSPAPDAGMVSFTADGATLPGCAAVTVAASAGRATCRATLAAGRHTLQAGYAGDPYFGASTSTALSEAVGSVPGHTAAPKLSGVSLGSRRFTARRGTTLRLTLSQSAALHVQVNRVVSGRKVKRRCRIGVKRGRRCTIQHRARRFSFHGKRGHNRLSLKTRGLPPGHYMATIVAVGSGGEKSRTVSVRFTIVRPRR
jgi:outer membrane protein assembly factor BamB